MKGRAWPPGSRVGSELQVLAASLVSCSRGLLWVLWVWWVWSGPWPGLQDGGRVGRPHPCLEQPGLTVPVNALADFPQDHFFHSFLAFFSLCGARLQMPTSRRVAS